MLKGRRAKTVDVHAHCYFQAALDLMGDEAKAVLPPVKGVPTCIICHTVKGKGISFMENQAGWHGKAPSNEQREQALKELEA